MYQEINPIPVRPWTLNGLSERLIVSHYENNYGGAVQALNTVRRELAALDAGTPGYRLRAVAGTYNPGFKIDLHFKDLGLIMESSRALGVPLPATAVVQELFNAMRVKGKGGLDHSGVITLLEELAGVPEQS